MAKSEDQSRPKRPGGRSSRVREAVMTATLQLLETRSVPELSVREIADEAGVAETTIYRRWGSLPGLISAALAEFALSENPIPDTGALEEDLTQLLRSVAAIIRRPSVRRIFGFVTALDDADAVGARKRFWETRFSAGSAIVDRAIERGEILPVSDPIAVIETLVGTAYVRTFLLDRPVTNEVISASVQSALRLVDRVADTTSGSALGRRYQQGPNLHQR